MFARDPETRDAVARYVARVKHDLGKYVAFQLRWLPEDAPLNERRAALAADLGATRRGPEGTLDAPSLWAELRPALVGEAALPAGPTVDLSEDPSVRCIDDAIAVIASALPGLAAADADEVDRATAAALAVSDACRDLVRRYAVGSE